jgi:type IX secretion system PorP/SprF family membrane protein
LFVLIVEITLYLLFKQNQQMKLKKYFILFILPTLFCNDLKAQNLFFLQPTYSRTYLNPAIAGTDSTLNLNISFQRELGYSYSGKPASTLFSADQYVRFLRGGIGFDLVHNVEGNAITSTNINLNYAPHFEIFKHKLSIQPGFSIGYLQKTIDWSQLTFGNQIDTNGFIYTSSPPYNTIQKKDNINFNAGVFIYSKKLYGGVAVMHVNQPDIGFVGPAQLPYKLTMHIGANLNFKKDLNKNFTLSPNIISVYQQNFNKTSLGITAKYKWFLFGVTYSQYNIILNAGLQNKIFKIGYSYYQYQSPLTNAKAGTHELQLTFYVPYRQKACPIKTIRFI